MYTSTIILSLLQLLIAQPTSAARLSSPSNNNHNHNNNTTLNTRTDSNTFQIQIHNNCPFPKQFALYQITSSFAMLEKSSPINIPSKASSTISAPYLETGMRLSGHAEWGTSRQWNAQALFEFGYSDITYAGQRLQGTAYDASVMTGSDADIGIGIYPLPNGKGSAKSCVSKTCFPWDCPAEQGWTDPKQVDLGSPADTVCYKGKMDFKVVFCP